MSSSAYNSRIAKQQQQQQGIEDKQQQQQYYQQQFDQDLYTTEELSEQLSKSSKHRSNHERKFKQIESVDEEAKINRQLRLQQKYSQTQQDSHNTRQHHSSLVKARKPLIIENVKIKHKLKRNASVRSPRTSSSSFHSSSASPVMNREKEKPNAIENETVTKTVKQQSSNNRSSPQSSKTKYHDLNNSLYLLEIELENERKKVNHEKEAKAKAIADLKTRFEFEKKAALKALEAKLTVEKLEEFNKYKENAEIEKNNEIDFIFKTNETELKNLKLKLREKSEKLVFLFSLI